MVTHWETETPTIKLIDFGLAKPISEMERCHTHNGLIQAPPHACLPIAFGASTKTNTPIILGRHILSMPQDDIRLKENPQSRLYGTFKRCVSSPVCGDRSPHSLFSGVYRSPFRSEPSNLFLPRVQTQLQELRDALKRALWAFRI